MHINLFSWQQIGFRCKFSSWGIASRSAWSVFGYLPRRLCLWFSFSNTCELCCRRNGIFMAYLVLGRCWFRCPSCRHSYLGAWIRDIWRTTKSSQDPRQIVMDWNQIGRSQSLAAHDLYGDFDGFHELFLTRQSRSVSYIFTQILGIHAYSANGDKCHYEYRCYLRWYDLWLLVKLLRPSFDPMCLCNLCWRIHSSLDLRAQH